MTKQSLVSLLLVIGAGPGLFAQEQMPVQRIVEQVDRNAEAGNVEKAEQGAATGVKESENAVGPAEQSGQAVQGAADVQAKPEPTEDELRKKMQELEMQLQATRQQFQQKAEAVRNKVQDEAKQAIEDIKLPANPTRQQCEAFVESLRKATQGRRSFSSNDPVTLKLKEIPPEHFDLLLKEINDRTSLLYFSNYAIREIDPEKLRDRFVKSIENNPDNIGIIVMQGWCEDIRPAIMSYMKDADSSVSPGWFQAAVEIDEPSLYPKLHEITTQSRYATQFISMLEMLPEYDLAHTLDVCWRRAREGKLNTSYASFAGKAVEYGNVDALGVLIEQLTTSSSYVSHSTSYNIRRTGVLRYIDFRGSNQEIQAWYKANKDKLVFDQLYKRFKVAEDF